MTRIGPSLWGWSDGRWCDERFKEAGEFLPRYFRGCQDGNRCRDCAGMHLRLRLSREQDWSEERYIEEQNKDRASWSEQDKLDVALAHPNFMNNNALTLPVYNMYMSPCGRFGCRVCKAAIARLATRLIDEIKEEERHEQAQAQRSAVG